MEHILDKEYPHQGYCWRCKTLLGPNNVAYWREDGGVCRSCDGLLETEQGIPEVLDQVLKHGYLQVIRSNRMGWGLQVQLRMSDSRLMELIKQHLGGIVSQYEIKPSSRKYLRWRCSTIKNIKRLSLASAPYCRRLSILLGKYVLADPLSRQVLAKSVYFKYRRRSIRLIALADD